jgi:hypothetical protein
VTPAIEALLRGTPLLAGAFLITLPDCLLLDGWQRDERRWEANAVAGHFGHLIRANREGLRAMSAWSQDMQVSIESDEATVVLRELTGSFALGCVFEGAPIGVARMQTRQIALRLLGTLPEVAPAPRTRAETILEHLARRGLLARVVQRSGLAPGRMGDPASLSFEEVAQLERAACQILGLATLGV